MCINNDPTTLLLDTYLTKDKDGNEILKYDYNFDMMGNITSITDSPFGIQKSIQSFHYDYWGRLEESAGNYNNNDKTGSYNRLFKYDDDNRIIEKTYQSGKKYLFNYTSNSHEISSVDIIADPEGLSKIQFAYDDFGNMIYKKTYSDLTEIENTNFIYDPANRLSRIDLPEGFKFDFKYDAGGQRIKKTYSDNVDTIGESVYVSGIYTIKDGNTSKYISDGSYVIATKIDNQSANIKYYHQNHIGSTALLTDNNGFKWQGYLYTPYGETWMVEEDIPDDDITRKFTGQEYDQESGLYYYNARYYDPHIGMFLRPDPAMSGLNHYAYASCNPVMYNDPTGLIVEQATSPISVVREVLVQSNSGQGSVGPAGSKGGDNTIIDEFRSPDESDNIDQEAIKKVDLFKENTEERREIWDDSKYLPHNKGFGELLNLKDAKKRYGLITGEDIANVLSDRIIPSFLSSPWN